MTHDPVGSKVIAVTGASGNIGTALVRRLVSDPRVREVRAVARRPPDPADRADRAEHIKVSWTAADVSEDSLATVFEGADAVVHLAWRIQPSWDLPAWPAST